MNKKSQVGLRHRGIVDMGSNPSINLPQEKDKNLKSMGM